MHSESVATQNLSFSNSEARENANLPTPSKPAASPTPPPPPRRPPPDLRRRTRALFLRASDVSRSHSPRCRPGSLRQRERGRWRRPRLLACDLICKSFAEVPTTSNSRRRSGPAVRARRGSRAPARAPSSAASRALPRARPPSCELRLEIRRGAAPLHAYELRQPSPPLAGGVALRSARAAPATPFLNSGVAPVR